MFVTEMKLKRQREIANKSSGLLLNCMQYTGFVLCYSYHLSISTYRIFPLNTSAKLVLSNNTHVHLYQHTLIQYTNPVLVGKEDKNGTTYIYKITGGVFGSRDPHHLL